MGCQGSKSGGPEGQPVAPVAIAAGALEPCSSAASTRDVDLIRGGGGGEGLPTSPEPGLAGTMVRDARRVAVEGVPEPIAPGDPPNRTPLPEQADAPQV